MFLLVLILYKINSESIFMFKSESTSFCIIIHFPLCLFRTLSPSPSRTSLLCLARFSSDNITIFIFILFFALRLIFISCFFHIYDAKSIKWFPWKFKHYGLRFSFPFNRNFLSELIKRQNQWMKSESTIPRTSKSPQGKIRAPLSGATEGWRRYRVGCNSHQSVLYIVLPNPPSSNILVK